jgi:hypothetical protein
MSLMTMTAGTTNQYSLTMVPLPTLLIQHKLGAEGSQVASLGFRRCELTQYRYVAGR